MIKLVVFDMAGTTIKDKKEVETCFSIAAKETGLQMTEAEILGAQGWAKRFVFETYWERQLGTRNQTWLETVEHSYQVFKNILEQHYRTNPVSPTEGCLETFDYLQSKGISIVLTTGFYRVVADIILGKLGWLDGLDANRIGTPFTRIQMSVTSDEVAKGRPAPDMIQKAMKALNIHSPKEVINIGDTPSDLASGRAAGCFLSLGVVNGTHTYDQLKDLPHDGLLANLRDLQKLV